MEMVKPKTNDGFPDEEDPMATLAKVPSRLNISKTAPKRFKFGTIIEKPEDIGLGQELIFCVFRVGIGKSYIHNLHEEYK